MMGGGRSLILGTLGTQKFFALKHFWTILLGFRLMTQSGI